MKQSNKVQKQSIFSKKLWIVYFALLIMIAVFCYKKQHSNPTQLILQQAVNSSRAILSELVKTKFFKMIRINLKSQCPLMVMNKLCKSKMCTVCRCDEKDIPSQWTMTDKVKSQGQGLDIWEQERNIESNLSKTWVWHVEDLQNDKGQYFDVDTNVESFTNYNGTNIWKFIYEENCFTGKVQQMCMQQQVFYQLISGLHTSISTHLSNLYRPIQTALQWADTGQTKFYVNQTEYKRRVLDHPERINNLLLLYQIMTKALRRIQPVLTNYRISSENINDDIKAKSLINDLFKQLNKIEWEKTKLQTEAELFFNESNTYVKQYQRYFHNISRILNCVQCEKCRLFGKMQTYGVGTAFKILLGYDQPYKRNQLVAFLNTLNKITISTSIYFNNQPIFFDRWHQLKVFGLILTVVAVFLWRMNTVMIKEVQKIQKIMQRQKDQ